MCVSVEEWLDCNYHQVLGSNSLIHQSSCDEGIYADRCELSVNMCTNLCDQPRKSHNITER